MGVLSGLKPSFIFEYFEKISAIPRKSGYNEKIADFIEEEARTLGYEVQKDALLNLVVFVPATKGYEDRPAVMLQGHMDMVPDVEPGYSHDFTKEPLDLFVEGDFIGARHTTLGGDNGVALIYMLALLKDRTIPHPALECVFTTDEEIGLLGCAGLDFSFSKAKYLLNLDSDAEGIFTVSCAGGLCVKTSFPLKTQRAGGHVYEITVSSSIGGHSGMEIHKGRPNTNHVTGLFLRDLQKELSCFYLKSLQGGLVDNAICKETRLTLVTPDNLDISYYDQLFKKEYESTDAVLSITLNQLPDVKGAEVFHISLQENLIHFLSLVPDGVQSVNPEHPDFVESSVNLGVIKTEDHAVTVVNSVRAALDSKKYHLADSLLTLGTLCGGQGNITGDYPGMAFNKDSELTKLVLKIWQEKYEKESGIPAKAMSIHAGLECGFIANAIPRLDIVSMGPEMKDIHSFRERLSISSTERCFRFLCDVLKEIK